MEYSISIIKNNIDRLKDEKSIRDSDGQKMIFDNEIACAIGIKPSTFCKRIHGTSDFSAKEIIALANFFDVSCDEIITGNSSKDTIRYGSNPLAKSSIALVNRLKYESPDCVELLNIILNNNDKNHLGERLLKIILYFCYGDIFKISSVTNSTPINADSSMRMLKLLALDDLSYLLDDIYKAWEKKMEVPDTTLERAIRKKMKEAPSAETRRRLRIKAKNSLKMKKGKTSTVKLINLIEELEK